MTATPVTQDVRPIRVLEGRIDAEIRVPGSKSITNRALIMAALAEGTIALENALFSEDSHHCADGLRKLGISIQDDPEAARFIVSGQGGTFPAAQADLYVGNSGTTARFLTAAAALGRGTYRFDGVARMRQRPIGELLNALRAWGARIDPEIEPDHFPFTIHADGLRGGSVTIDATDSSQLLSGLLMAAPYADHDAVIDVTGTVVSQPYIDITLRMMEQFGVQVENQNYARYLIPHGQRYMLSDSRYVIEPDASGASYFFAAAALTGGRVRIPDLTADALQGDAKFVDVLEQMGAHVTRGADYLEVIGTDHLRGVSVNMNAISDTAQTLAAIAPFADSPTHLYDIGHIRHKETDRIGAVVAELRKLGVRCDETEDSMTIYPAHDSIHGGQVATYNDHRMAMSFAVLGLRVPGVVIRDPGCTAKTFPDFFDRFERLYPA